MAGNNNMTLEQMATELNNLRPQITALTTKAAANAVKPAQPTYNGSKGTLHGFMTQLHAYHLFYAHELPTDLDKILYAASYLKGDTLDWFKPTLHNYLEHNAQPPKMDSDTQAIFQGIDKFEESLQSTFGDPDKERTAEHRIRNLHQCRSAAEYASQYRQIISKLG